MPSDEDVLDPLAHLDSSPSQVDTEPGDIELLHVEELAQDPVKPIDGRKSKAKAANKSMAAFKEIAADAALWERIETRLSSAIEKAIASKLERVENFLSAAQAQAGETEARVNQGVNDITGRLQNLDPVKFGQIAAQAFITQLQAPSQSNGAAPVQNGGPAPVDLAMSGIQNVSGLANVPGLSFGERIGLMLAPALSAAAYAYAQNNPGGQPSNPQNHNGSGAPSPNQSGAWRYKDGAWRNG